MRRVGRWQLQEGSGRKSFLRDLRPDRLLVLVSSLSKCHTHGQESAQQSLPEGLAPGQGPRPVPRTQPSNIL